MNPNANYINTQIVDRQKRKTILTVLAVLSVIVALVVFWSLKLTGITFTGEALCELSEHTHDGSCYEYTLICTDEDETHEHTADCVNEELICIITEHTHTRECYEDVGYDVPEIEGDEVENEVIEYGEDTGLIADEGEIDAEINYINELTSVVKDVSVKKTDGTVIGPEDVLYIGQEYVFSVKFAEDNEGDEWIQFKHDEDHHLHYQIPSNLQCEPFDWHPITAKTENGTIEDVGKYKVNEDGLMIVVFDDDPVTGECYGSKYSNVEFTIDFNAKIGSTNSGDKAIVDYGNEVVVEYVMNGSAGINMTKNHGEYDSSNHTMEYTIRVEATHGLVKDFTLEDYTWNTHQILRDTIVVTDLEGNPLDPQPTVGDSFTASYSGFSLVDFPDFSAGEGYLINYKTKVEDSYISNDSVALSNGAYGAGRDTNGATFGSYKEDYVVVKLEKIAKDGKQTVIKNADGEEIPVIEWEVAIRKNNSNLQGTVVIDTLGEGLQYYKDQPILIKHYDEWGNALEDQYLTWDKVEINGNSMSFPLPDGYMFDIYYYTTYDIPADGKEKQYNNSVSATINGKYETAGGEADVVGFIPRVQKSAYGDDGKYVYFTIAADVPGVIKDWGGFYLSDTASLWKEATQEFLYSENFPQNLVITAETKSGRTIEFTPYVEGGPTENTYIILAPGMYNTHHTFEVFFNTSTADKTSSKWILNEDATLTITYKIPFDSKTGGEWEGSLTGDKLLVDALLDGFVLNNKSVLNYTSVIQTDDTALYKYTPKIYKKSKTNTDGTIDYTVIFYSTIPGTNGNGGYLSSSDIVYFTDTFDERLEYVQGSLTVTCYNPWNSNIWLNRYRYNGTVSDNSMEIASTEFTFDKWNPECGWDEGWLSGLSNYQIYCNNMSGGEHIFTYKLKVKDDYLYSTEQTNYEFDNTAEIKWDTDGSSGPATDNVEFNTGLVDKTVAPKDNILDFSIEINRFALDILEGVDTLVVEDTMTPNLSVYWESIKLFYEDEKANEGEKINWIDFDSTNKYDYSVTYDQDTNKLTFVIPDKLHVKIDYSTLMTESGMVSVSNNVSINASAEVSDIIDATFHVQDHSGDAWASMHELTLLKQDGETDVRLPDVTFHLYGPMPDPDAKRPDGVASTVPSHLGKNLGYIGSYTTGADGTVLIKTQYLTVGGPYALVEANPPEGYMALTKPVYFYFYNNNNDETIQTVTTLIAVENFTFGELLPETGSVGTLPFTICGGVLMALPLLYCIQKRRKERRRIFAKL